MKLVMEKRLGSQLADAFAGAGSGSFGGAGFLRHLFLQ